MALLELLPRVARAGFIATDNPAVVTWNRTHCGLFRGARGRALIFGTQRRFGHPVDDQVDAIFVTAIVDGVQGGVVNFPQFTFGEHFFFAADGEHDLVIGDDRNVDAVAFQQTVQAVGMGIDPAVSRQARKQRTMPTTGKSRYSSGSMW
jgi:hypothetical protein